MSYYVIFNFDVRDPEMYGQYAQAAAGAARPGMKALAFDTAGNDLEGESRGSILILEFESEETAMAWYHSPEYQAISHLREDSTDGWLRGVPEFIMPAH